MQNTPRYPLSSVDNALELLALLQRRRNIGVSEAARALGIAKSTAHRLLSMLAYHGLAEQDEARLYRSTQLETSSDNNNRTLERLLHPYVDKLAHVTGQTANTQVMTGRIVRIIDCVPGTEPVCVGDRRGVAFRPESASGGLALLSLKSHEEVSGLYLDDREVSLPRLFATLARVRRQGFAFNLGYTEPHIRAVGVPVRDESGAGVAALVLSVPADRFSLQYRLKLAESLTRMARLAQAELGWTSPSPHSHRGQEPSAASTFAT